MSDGNSGNITIKHNHVSNFHWMPNHIIEEYNEMSWKAKSILNYLGNRPNNWKLNKTDVVNKSSEGKKAVGNALEELRERGFLTYEKERDKEGKISGMKWIIDYHPNQNSDDDENPPEVPSIPEINPEPRSPDSGLSSAGLSDTNNNNINNKEYITNLESENSKSKKRDLIRKYIFHPDSPQNWNSEFDFDYESQDIEDLTENKVAVRVFQYWYNWLGAIPSFDSGKQIATAKDIVKQLDEVKNLMAALLGIDELYPYSDGEPWDLFDLRRKLEKSILKGNEVNNNINRKSQNTEDTKMVGPGIEDDEYQEILSAAEKKYNNDDDEEENDEEEED